VPLGALANIKVYGLFISSLPFCSLVDRGWS
jgi:hypothetical protein